MATMALSSSSRAPGSPTSPTTILPPIHEAVPQIRSARPRTCESADSEVPRHVSYQATGSTRLADSCSFAPSPVRSRRKFARHLSDTEPCPPDLYVRIVDAPESRWEAQARRAPSPGEDPAREVVSAPPSATKGGVESAAPFIPPLRSFHSTVGHDEIASVERPTIPSIFGNDHGRNVVVRSADLDRPRLTPPYELGRHPAHDHSPSSAFPVASYSTQTSPGLTLHRRGSYPGTASYGLERYPFSPGDSQSVNYETSGDYHEQRSKRRRGNLPKSTTDILKAWFHSHLSHPYPSEEEKQILMCQTRLTMSQISNWFINCRRRHLPLYTRQMRADIVATEQQRLERESREEEHRRLHTR